MSERTPVPFGKYELLEKIGVGGMAEIYRARVEGPGGFEKILVLKKILPAFAENRAFVQMLISEAKVSSVLHHANIVQIYELGEIEGQYYIAMEYVDGDALADIVDGQAPMPLDRVVRIGVNVDDRKKIVDAALREIDGEGRKLAAKIDTARHRLTRVQAEIQNLLEVLKHMGKSGLASVETELKELELERKTLKSQIKEMTEDAATGSLTIVVEV